MLQSTAENSPVSNVGRRPTVNRQRFRPEKKKKAGVESGFFSELSPGEMSAVILLGFILAILVGPPVLPLALPLSQIWFAAYRTRPIPPGAREFFYPVLLLTIFPGLGGVVGFLQLELLFLTGQFEVLRRPLDRFIIGESWQLVAMFIPAYLLTLIYFIRLSLLDRATVSRFIRAEQEEQARLENDRQVELAEKQRAREEELRNISAGGAILLGEILERTWEPQSATWIWGKSAGLEGKLCYLTPEHLRRNTGVVATTRSGKTQNLIYPIVDSCLKNHHAAIVFDPKGTDFNPAQFDLSFSLQPGEAKTSFRLCLIDLTLDPTKAVAKLAEALIKENREQPFFSDSSRQALIGIMLGHRAVTGNFPELSEVIAYSQDKTRRADLFARLNDLHSDQGKPLELRLAAEDAARLLKVVEQRASNPRSDALGSLFNAVLPLATGQYRHYVTTDPTYGINIRELLDRGLVARVAFTADEGEIGRALGKIVVQQFTDAVLSPTINRERLKLLIIDEAHNYVCESLKVGIVQAPSNNAGYVLSFQSLKQIPDEDTRSIILGNCKNRFILSGAEFSDAELFSKDFGEQELEFHSTGSNRGESTSLSEQVTSGTSRGRNAGRNYGSNHEGASSGGSSSTSSGLSESESRGTSTGQSRGTSEQVSYHLRPVWLPGEISRLPRFYAVGITDDGRGDQYPVPISFLEGEKLRQELAFRFMQLEFKPVTGENDPPGKKKSLFSEEKFMRCQIYRPSSSSDLPVENAATSAMNLANQSSQNSLPPKLIDDQVDENDDPETFGEEIL